MPIEFECLSQDNVEPFLEHLRKTRELNWTGPQLDEFVNWRYFGRRDTAPVMALSGNTCIAFIDSQLRDYMSGNKVIRVQESSEWYCEPKYRPTGLGIRVLQQLTQREYPVLSVRGTEASQQLLIKLGWQNLRPVVLFHKMNNWRETIRTIWNRVAGPNDKELTRTVGDTQALAGAPSPDELNSIHSTKFSSLAPALSKWELDWFSNAPPTVGEFAWYRFTRDSSFIGYALCRLYQGAEYRRAQIVHLASRDDDVRIYRAMLTHLGEMLSQRGIIRVLARCSSTKMIQAFHDQGYTASAPQPVFLSDTAVAQLIRGDTHLTYLRGDDSFRPLPSFAPRSQ